MCKWWGRDGRSGDVGPVVFDDLQTWWVIARCGVMERLQVCGRWFFDELGPVEVWLDDLFENPAGGTKLEVVYRSGA